MNHNLFLIIPIAFLLFFTDKFAEAKNTPHSVVYPTRRCGGVGTPIQLRISECHGRCQFVPWKTYQCEKDFMPSTTSPSLSLRVEVCLNTGFCHEIVNSHLPGAPVQPGYPYTVKYSVSVNEILAGQTVEFRATVMHTVSGIVEVCVAADVDILELEPPTTTIDPDTTTEPVTTTESATTTTTMTMPTETTKIGLMHFMKNVNNR